MICPLNEVLFYGNPKTVLLHWWGMRRKVHSGDVRDVILVAVVLVRFPRAAPAFPTHPSLTHIRARGRALAAMIFALC